MVKAGHDALEQGGVMANAVPWKKEPRWPNHAIVKEGPAQGPRRYELPLSPPWLVRRPTGGV